MTPSPEGLEKTKNSKITTNIIVLPSISMVSFLLVLLAEYLTPLCDGVSNEVKLTNAKLRLARELIVVVETYIIKDTKNNRFPPEIFVPNAIRNI